MTLDTLRPFTAADAPWLVARHSALYAEEEGYDASFGDLVAAILGDFLARHDPARERGWVAQRDETRLGSIFCMAEGPEEPETARLRLFLLEPSARGTGLAQTMFEQCLAFARASGYGRIRLWTHASHRAACRLYARNGFSCTRSWTEHSFGRDTVSQIWERGI